MSVQISEIRKNQKIGRAPRPLTTTRFYDVGIAIHTVPNFQFVSKLFSNLQKPIFATNFNEFANKISNIEAVTKLERRKISRKFVYIVAKERKSLFNLTISEVFQISISFEFLDKKWIFDTLWATASSAHESSQIH